MGGQAVSITRGYSGFVTHYHFSLESYQRPLRAFILMMLEDRKGKKNYIYYWGKDTTFLDINSPVSLLLTA